MGKVHVLKPRAGRRVAPVPRKPAANEDAAVFEGSELIRLVLERGDEAALTQSQLATRLGMSVSYLAMLSRGPRHKPHRRVQDLSIKQLKKMAAFLERPLMDVLVLAEIVGADEQYVAADLKVRVDSVIERWRADPVWNRLAPTRLGWKRTKFADQVRMAVLYDHLAHRTRILPEPHLISFEDNKVAAETSQKRGLGRGEKRAAAR